MLKNIPIEWLVVGISLLITGVVSTITATASSLIFGWHFLGIWLLSFVGQYFIYQCLSLFLDHKAKKLETALQLVEAKARGEIKAHLSCAYCAAPNDVVIYMEELISEFQCNQCKQTNKVFYQFATSQITNPPPQSESIREALLKETVDPTPPHNP